MQSNIIFHPLTLIALTLSLNGCASKPTILAPDPPPKTAESTTILDTKRSVIALDVAIPFAEIQKSIESAAPTSDKGEEHPDINDLNNEKLTWSITRGPIAVETSKDKKSAVIGSDFTGVADFSARAAIIGVSGHVDAAAHLALSMAPSITPKWGLEPHVDVQDVAVTRAQGEIRVIGIKVKTIDLGNKVKELILKDKNKWLAEANKKIAATVDLHKEVEKAWKSLGIVAKVAEVEHDHQIGVWVVVSPQSIAMAPFDYSDGKNVKGKIVVLLNVSSQVSREKPVPINAIPLPDLQQNKDRPDGFEIQLPTTIPFETLNTLAAAKLSNQTFTDAAKKITCEVKSASLYANGDNVILKSEVNCSYHNVRANGTIYLTGKLAFDAAKQKLHIEGLEYTLQTKNVIAKAADWLLSDSIKQQLQTALVFDVTSDLVRAKNAANEQLEKFKLKLPKEIDAHLKLTSLDVDSVRVSHDAIVVVFLGRGQLSATLRRP